MQMQVTYMNLDTLMCIYRHIEYYNPLPEGIVKSLNSFIEGILLFCVSLHVLTHFNVIPR